MGGETFAHTGDVHGLPLLLAGMENVFDEEAEAMSEIKVTDEEIASVVEACNRYEVNIATLILGEVDGCLIKLVASNNPDDIDRAD